VMSRKPQVFLKARFRKCPKHFVITPLSRLSIHVPPRPQAATAAKGKGKGKKKAAKAAKKAAKVAEDKAAEEAEEEAAEELVAGDVDEEDAPLAISFPGLGIGPCSAPLPTEVKSFEAARDLFKLAMARHAKAKEVRACGGGMCLCGRGMTTVAAG